MRQGAFGTTRAGESVEQVQLANANGICLSVLSYGGVIRAIHLPDRDGVFTDVALGYDTLDGYLADTSYFGALVGRVANRVRAGRMTVDGRELTLARNAGGNHLHGGERGFDKAVWRMVPFERDAAAGVVLSHVSPDGDEGYPGTLHAEVTYTLDDSNELRVDYLATTDAVTPVNLTQHSYFNLSGEGIGDVLGHEITLAASHFTPVDDALIPTGELRAVQGTPFDFTTPRRVGDRIGEPDAQLTLAGGYDHNFVIDRASPNGLALAAQLTDPVSGRGVDVFTTEPGIQFYSGNFLDGSAIGKRGRPYAFRTGLALETQHFPDAPNHPEFPSIVLRPGSEYRTSTIYRFVVRPS
ncbi:MAG: aldose epimerase family protein [bacterium]